MSHRLGLRVIGVVACAWLATPAWGQSCPVTLQVRSEAALVETGWSTKPAVSTHRLSGVSIIEGPLADPEPEAVLRPQDTPRGAIWRFRGPIGSNEAWMRCFYAGTAVQWVRRIEATVTECEERFAPGSGPGRATLAACR